MAQSLPYEYQVGGSLPADALCYVHRQADEDLYGLLLLGNFCYVLDARQMGKSSLRVRVMRRLQDEGVCTGVIDMSCIGSQQLTPEQWYASILKSLINSFGLTLNLRAWWQERSHLSIVKRFGDFLEEVLLKEISQDIVIFIDEIDSVLGLKFPVDDFFALIRSCYNRRVEQPVFKRLTFSLFGVATPTDLITDKSRTPFNIGHAIPLRGFQFHEAVPLLLGLKLPQPSVVLRHILDWTGGQPFLTQKLCYLALNAPQDDLIPGHEDVWVKNLVQKQAIDHWEIQDEPEHFRTIATRLLNNEQRAGRLLGVYQQVLRYGKQDVDDSTEQIELLLSGLVVKEDDYLTIRNRIYAAIFNLEWVERQLAKRRPYSEALTKWLNSERTDKSRLLRGQALQDAQLWARDKSLSDQDYQFLAASEKLEQSEIQQALEAARALEVTARLIQEKQTAQLQGYLLVILSIALVVLLGLGWGMFWQNRNAKLSEIQAIAKASEALFASNRGLDALVEAIRARRQLLALGEKDSKTAAQVESVLRQAVYSAVEYNRFSGHQDTVYSVVISPDGKIFASASRDGTVKLWAHNGKLLNTLKGHGDWVTDVAFSPDGQTIVSVSKDKTVKLWQRDGRLLKTFEAHRDVIWKVAFSPTGKFFATASWDGSVKVWTLSGRLVRTFEEHQSPVWGVAFSPDGQLIASGGADKTVRIWSLDGRQIRTLQGHSDRISTVAFSPDGQVIASGSKDSTVKVWTWDGNLIETYKGHRDEIWDVAFSSDGQRLISSSSDGTVQIWQGDGTLLTTLNDRAGRVFRSALSRDGKWLVSTGSPPTIKLWKLKDQLLVHLRGHKDWAIKVGFSSNGKLLASTSADRTVKLWTPSGHLLTTFSDHRNTTVPVAFSPDGKIIASATEEGGTIKLWQPNGTAIATLPLESFASTGHQKGVFGLAFSPDGQILVSGSLDKTIKLWNTSRPEFAIAIATLKGHNAEVVAVQFSPDGKQLVTASWDKTIKLWKRDGSFIRTLAKLNVDVNDVAFSPDGRTIASVDSSCKVKLWTLDGKLIRTFTGHGADAIAVAFSPDGKLLASSSRDRTIKLWQKDGTLVATLKAHTNTVSGVAFSPDGKQIASSSWDKTVIVWDLKRVIDLDGLLKFGCQWIRDYLQTNAELDSSDRNLCDGVLNPRE